MREYKNAQAFSIGSIFEGKAVMKIGMKMKHTSKLFLRNAFVCLALIWTLFLFSSANAEHAGITLPKIEKEFVVERAKLKCVEGVDTNDSTRRASSPGCLLQMVSKNYAETRTADIYAIKDHVELNWPPNEPSWSGLSSGLGIDVIRVTGAGEEYATVGSITKFATIEIIDGKETSVIVGESDFQSMKNILTNIATALGGSSEDVECNIQGVYLWYNVDQTGSPYCKRTDELSIGGDFELNHTFYILGLSFDMWLVKGGAFVKPSVELNINGIDIKHDGAVNPMAFTRLGGGAKIMGSISAGGKLEAEDPWEVIKIEGTLEGVVSASGSFDIKLPGPKVSGAYDIGKVNLSGSIEVTYRLAGKARYEVNKDVWSGINGTATADLSKYFIGN